MTKRLDGWSSDGRVEQTNVVVRIQLVQQRALRRRIWQAELTEARPVTERRKRFGRLVQGGHREAEVIDADDQVPIS